MKNREYNSSVRKLLVTTVALLIPASIAYLYFAFYTEHNSSWSIQCGFHALTGWQCPGCGGQRSVHFLLHGEILKALRYNALFVVGLPFLAYMYYLIVSVHGLKKTVLLNSFFYSSLFAKLALGIILGFFILRNIPYFPFIYLSPPY